MTIHATLTLNHGAGETPIVIGTDLLARQEFWQAHLGSVTEDVFIVSDENVASLYGASVEAALGSCGLRCGMHVIAAGEASKSWAVLEEICRGGLLFGMRRGSVLVALGGGVVGDVAGLTAALIMRGVTLVQCPTTLMAQLDSAIGGKTGINDREGKNLIGAFHQARLVVADCTVLQTLKAREMRAGYAELVKYALLGEKELFGWLEKNGGGMMDCDENALLEGIKAGALMKSRIVAEDVHETSGRRALLNLGHTFGHAFEAACGYDGSLLHGEAVAGGLLAALAFSVRLKKCPQEDFMRLVAHLKAVGLDTAWRTALKAKKVTPKALCHHMRFDKKNTRAGITLILCGGIGDAFVSGGHDAADIEAFLASFLAQEGVLA